MSEIIRDSEPRPPYDDERLEDVDDDVDIDPALLETLEEDGAFEPDTYHNEHEPSEDDVIKQDR